MGTICSFFQEMTEMWEMITEMDVESASQCWYCELDPLQVAKRYLEMIKERPMKTSEME
jgi:hypothetical protein